MELQAAPSRVDWSTNLALLQSKVYQVLSETGALRPQDISVLFDDVAMKEWAKCFTHKTVDANNNNDGLEFYGDATLKYAFPMYFSERLSDVLDQRSATLLTNYYMSTDYQAHLSRTLGLVEYVRYDPAVPGINDKVSEDTFEAFIGTLNKLANRRIQNGMGYLYAFNILIYLFQNVNLDPSRIEKDDITKLKEIFDKLEWGQPNYVVVQSENPTLGQYRATVSGSNRRVLGSGYGPTQDKSRSRAAKAALVQLASEGTTLETAERIKLERTLRTNPAYARQNERLEKAIANFSAEAVRRGKAPIKDFRIYNVNTERTGKSARYTVGLQVSAVSDDGTVSWYTIKQLTGDDNNETKIKLMKEFADQQKVAE